MPDQSKNGFVYLIRLGEFTKIGNSASPEQRFACFRTLPYESALLHCIRSANARHIEKALHRQFRSKHVKGEWFRLDDSDLGQLMALSSVDSLDDLPPSLRPEEVAVKQARFLSTSFRLEPQDFVEMDLIAEHYARETGVSYSRTDVLHLVARLEANRIRKMVR